MDILFFLVFIGWMFGYGYRILYCSFSEKGSDKDTFRIILLAFVGIIFMAIASKYFPYLL